MRCRAFELQTPGNVPLHACMVANIHARMHAHIHACLAVVLALELDVKGLQQALDLALRLCVRLRHGRRLDRLTHEALCPGGFRCDPEGRRFPAACSSFCVIGKNGRP